MVAGKSNSKSIPKARPLRGQLGEVVVHLRQAQAALSVSVAALKQQNCELDEDIAAVLQRGVADRLQDQIERLEGTIGGMSNLERRK